MSVFGSDMDHAKLVRAKMYLNRRNQMDMEHVELAQIARILNKLSDDLRLANDRMEKVEQAAREASTSAAFLVKTLVGRND
jgi:hypothetical protein